MSTIKKRTFEYFTQTGLEFCHPTTANQRAARKAVAERLDSTQNIPPRICRLPAQVVEPRITVAGNTKNNKKLLWQSAALALLLICT